MQQLRPNMNVFINITELRLESKNITHEISPQIKTMPSLQKVYLQQEVYNKISTDFLQHTNIEFKIL